MFLQLRGLDKRYGTEQVLDEVQLDLAEHQTLSILGRSGSGKTTLLKIIAGLEAPDRGSILVEGEDLTRTSPSDRNVVYLYQEPLLFPHLNVFENIAFGLRLQKRPEAEVQQRVREMIEHLDLQAHPEKAPHQLSGGQRQRVAFGRAIIINPRVLLLDEPFGSLDVEIRADMQRLFQRLVSAYGMTTLFVTHDLKEALLMGQQIAALRNGRLTVYPSKEAFIKDPATGVQNEITFWQQIAGTHYSSKT